MGDNGCLARMALKVEDDEQGEMGGTSKRTNQRRDTRARNLTFLSFRVVDVLNDILPHASWSNTIYHVAPALLSYAFIPQ